ncbi:unnamed protein product [Gadus morhua 'NCC']
MGMISRNVIRNVSERQQQSPADSPTSDPVHSPRCIRSVIHLLGRTSQPLLVNSRCCCCCCWLCLPACRSQRPGVHRLESPPDGPVPWMTAARSRTAGGTARHLSPNSPVSPRSWGVGIYPLWSPDLEVSAL